MYYDLTTTAQIRSVLSVGEVDLSDETIEGYGLDDDLGVWLDGRLPTWESLVEDKHKRKLRLAAKYFCAGTLAVMAPVFILKKISDGSNEGQRSDKDGFAWISEDLLGKAKDAMDDLLADLDLTPEIPAVTYFSRVVPDRDPITEPRSAE